MTVPYRILHLTDTHLYGDDTLHYGKVNTTEALKRTLQFVERIPELDLVVCSGDVSEDGSIASYANAKQLLSEYAFARGAELVFAMGNHDLRENFRLVLGEAQNESHITARLGDGSAGSNDAPIASSGSYNGLRVIVLDSSVPRAGHGDIEEDQFAWLETELAKRKTPDGTVLVIHHPPVAAETELLNALSLQQTERFTKILRDSDVRLILSGHYHFQLQQSVAGIPLVVSSAVANQSTLFADPQEESAHYGSGGSLITFTGERDYRVLPFSVPHPKATERVFTFAPEEVTQLVEYLNSNR